MLDDAAILTVVALLIVAALLLSAGILVSRRDRHRRAKEQMEYWRGVHAEQERRRKERADRASLSRTPHHF